MPPLLRASTLQQKPPRSTRPSRRRTERPVRLRITVEFTGAGSSPKNRVSFRRRQLLDGLLRQRPRTRRDRGGSAAPTAHHAGGGPWETHGGDRGLQGGVVRGPGKARFGRERYGGPGPSRHARRVPSSEPIRPVSQPCCDEPSNPADGDPVRVVRCGGGTAGRGSPTHGASGLRGPADGAPRRPGRPIFRPSRNAGTGCAGRAGRALTLRRALGRAVWGAGWGEIGRASCRERV